MEREIHVAPEKDHWAVEDGDAGIGSIYETRLSDRGRLHLTLTGARSHQRISVSTIAVDTVATAAIGRGELEWRIVPGATLRAGYDVLFAPYTARGQLPEDRGPNAPPVRSTVTAPTLVFDRHALFFMPAVYAEMDARFGRRLQIVT